MVVPPWIMSPLTKALVESAVSVNSHDAQIGLVVHVADELSAPLLTEWPPRRMGHHGVRQSKRENMRCLGSILNCPSLRLSEIGAIHVSTNEHRCQMYVARIAVT